MLGSRPTTTNLYATRMSRTVTTKVSRSGEALLLRATAVERGVGQSEYPTQRAA